MIASCDRVALSFRVRWGQIAPPPDPSRGVADLGRWNPWFLPVVESRNKKGSPWRTTKETPELAIERQLLSSSYEGERHQQHPKRVLPEHPSQPWYLVLGRSVRPRWLYWGYFRKQLQQPSKEPELGQCS